MSASAHTSWVALCYHDVQPAMPRGGGGPSHFTTPLASFELMLDTIATSGYNGCSLADAIARPGTRRVAITFDDGNLGQYEYAFRALRDRGMTATFYITTDWVGQRDFVTWDHLREMVAAGMSVQSHTRSHPFLSELNADALGNELRGSKQVLDRELKQNTSEIAFPGGDPPSMRLRYLLEECGYPVAVGSRWGINTDRRIVRGRGFVVRCSMRGELAPEMARRIVRADRWLTFGHTAKESTLRSIRSTLGPTRYARLRRKLLDAIAG
jgi:hypothetical protein